MFVRGVLSWGTGGRKQAFHELYGEQHGLDSEALADMRGVGRLKAARPQIAAGKGAEAGREGFGETVAAGGGFFVAHAVCRAENTREHERAFHQTALGPEAACPVHARGGVQRLRLKGNAEPFAETEQHGFRAVVVLIPVEFMHAFRNVVHTHLPYAANIPAWFQASPQRGRKRGGRAP